MQREPRLRRRRAARPHELPELRQPREAAHRLAAHPRHLRPRDACRAFGIPVVGGNVSLYNEGGGGPIYPTPVVGLVGELPDAARAGRLGFAQPGDAIALVSAGWAPSNAASELSKLRGEPVEGPLPSVELGELKALHAAIRQAVRTGTINSAHDVAEGGVAIALAECAIASGLGATISGLGDLFGEGPGAFVVSGPAESLTAFGAADRSSARSAATRSSRVLSVPVVDLERAPPRAGRPPALMGGMAAPALP